MSGPYPAGRRSAETTLRATALAASVTFGWQAMLKIKHVPMQLFDVTMLPVMFTLLFTYRSAAPWPGRPASTCSSCCRASSS